MSALTNFQVTDCKFLKNPLFSLFPIEKSKLPFDLAIKYVKVTPGSSFEQTMMGWSPMLHTKFREKRPAGSGEDF